MIRTALIDGRRVSFRREVGDGPALVCIHGAANNHHFYDRLFDALPGHALIAVDLPGRVGSDGPPLTSVAAVASFLERFVESQVGDDHVLMGNSLGGAAAIEYALATRPATLRGLVLAGTGARLRVHPTILEAFEKAAFEGRTIPATEADFAPDVDQRLIDEVNAALLLTPPDVAARDWRVIDAFDRLSDVDRINVPSLIIGGVLDQLTPPKYATYLSEQIGQSELHLLEDCGHMVLIERPEVVSILVDAFLRRVGG